MTVSSWESGSGSMTRGRPRPSRPWSEKAAMKNLTLSELVKSLWRRPVWFLTPVVLGLVGAYVSLQFMPTIYRATTQVLVEPQK
ncbi:MAG: Wzz/FepE/Etk N-terminal domain-containing protein, partial [Thermoanaerobaculia bacterium]